MLSSRGVILLIAIICISAFKVNAQVEDITSRFYFPGSVGLAIPFKNIHTRLGNGFAFNTGVEYRPTYISVIFQDRLRRFKQQLY